MSEDTLKQLDQLIQKLADVRSNIEHHENSLKVWKKKEALLVENEIPGLMGACGQEILRTTSGFNVELKEEVYARIPVDKKEEAFDWLESNNEGGMIKEELIRSVHPQTLKAWVRGKLKDGAELPEDLFGIYVKRVAKVKDSVKKDFLKDQPVFYPHDFGDTNESS